MDRKALLLGVLKRVTQPGELVVSRGALNRFAAFPACRVVVVAGGRSDRSVPAKVIDQVGKAGGEAVNLAIADGEPTPASVAELAAAVRDLKPDWIVAVGGGRVIDAAKFGWAAYEHPSLDLAGEQAQEVPPLRKKCRLAAVPTTAGSGSEASIAAVISCHGRKIPWISHHWVPDLVILDPEALKGIPSALMAETGLDAVTHAIEAFVSRLDHPLAQRFAVEALPLLLDALPRALAGPNDGPTLETLQFGAYLAGLAQSAAATGLAHALSHAAGAVLHVPHARATAAMLLPSIRINRRRGGRAGERYDALTHASGLKGVDELCSQVEDIVSRSSIPSTLSALAGRPLADGERALLVRLVGADPSLRTNVMPVASQDIEAILDEVS
jgi:alcohol dehydrogenase class IV